MSELITSRKNETVRRAAKLLTGPEARRQQGRFLLEGARLCNDAAQSGVVVKELFYTEQAAEKYGVYLDKIRLMAENSTVLAPHVAELLAETKTPQGVFCVCTLPQAQAPLSALPQRHALALENMQDPQNTGAMLRTAEALGVGGVILLGSCCDVYAPKVLRASMGAVFRLPFFYVPDFSQAAGELHRRGFQTLAAVPSAQAVSVTQVAFGAPTVMVVGNEGNGLLPQTIVACSRAVTIPMLGRAESLNAATSAAILLWEMMRRGGAQGIAAK